MSGVPGPDHRDYWPEHPVLAEYVDGPILGRLVGPCWVVRSVPPDGWFRGGPPYPRAEFGPPRTLWVFKISDVVAQAVHLPGWLGLGVLNRLLRRLKVVVVDLDFATWRTPEYVRPPIEGERMRWIHATVIGKLGTDETVAHTFNFRTAPTLDVDQDAAAIQAFAVQVRDKWAAFMNTAQVSTKLWNGLQYTEVRATYLEQTAPATVTTKPGKRGPVKVFTYPRPAVLVPTQFSNFQGAQIGSATDVLPFEVALGLTHTTGLRGARHRGRVYLGGLSATCIDGSQGRLATAAVEGIAAAYGTTFVQGLNTSTGNRLHIVSRTFCDSVPVTGVSVGHVPDSQRRRRRSQKELPTVKWTAPA